MAGKKQGDGMTKELEEYIAIVKVREHRGGEWHTDMRKVAVEAYSEESADRLVRDYDFPGVFEIVEVVLLSDFSHTDYYGMNLEWI